MLNFTHPYQTSAVLTKWTRNTETNDCALVRDLLFPFMQYVEV